MLITSRFTLKILTPEMVGEDYLSWFSNEEKSGFISYAKNKVTMLDLKSYAEEKLKSPKALFFGIFLNDSSKHIGNIKFEPIDFSAGYAVLGVWIGDNSWRGVGVFPEIYKELEKKLSSDNIKRIYLGVEKDNTAAINAYLKEGFIIDKENFLKSDLDIAICMIKELL